MIPSPATPQLEAARTPLVRPWASAGVLLALPPALRLGVGALPPTTRIALGEAVVGALGDVEAALAPRPRARARRRPRWTAGRIFRYAAGAIVAMGLGYVVVSRFTRRNT